MTLDQDCLTIVVRADPVSGAVVLVARGEIDLRTVGLFQHELLGAIEETSAEAVVLDAGDVEFVSSAGLAVLLTAAHRAAMRNRRFHVVTGSQRSISRPLEAAGLDHLVATCPTYLDALSPRPTRAGAQDDQVNVRPA